MILGSRLQAVADFIEVEKSFADIGTDHAYLPIYMVKENLAERSIACDVHQGPYEAAKKTVVKYGVMERVEVRLGNGLTALRPGEVEAAVIAGMGGITIIEILAKSPEVVGHLSSLVLQPQNAAEEVRRWLQKHAWAIFDETLAMEDERIYEILLAKPGATLKPLEDILYDIGPCLWQKRHPLLKRHIENLRGKVLRAMQGMKNSVTAMESEKYQQLKRKLAALEEKLECL